MDTTDVIDRKATFVSEVARYVEQRRRDEAFTREELGRLDSQGRLQSQRQSLLDNISHYYSQNPNADVAPGLLVIITFYADNNDGACTMSKARLAKFLSRTPRAIQDAIHRLGANQTILVEERDGDTNFLSPWVLKAFGEIRDPLTWIFDVRAPTDAQKRAGRPRKAATVERVEKPSSPPFNSEQNQSEINTREAAFSPFPENRGEAGRQIGEKPASPNTTKNTTVEVVVPRTSEAPDKLLRELFSEAQLDAFNGRYATWAQSPVKRELTDGVLSGEMMAARRRHPECQSTMLDAAAITALTTLIASTPTGKHGAASMLSLFRQSLDGEIARPKVKAQARSARPSSRRMSEFEAAKVAFGMGNDQNGE